MKFNKNYLFNFILITLNQFHLSHGASVKISKSDLDDFDYGEDEFTMTIHGDTGTEKEATEVMNLAKFDAILHLGDYDYECKPDSYFNNILKSNRSYKFFGILGNHESSGECGESRYYQYINNIYDKMKSSKNRGTSCTFSPKKTMWSCSYKNMRIIGLSPSISKDEKRKEQLDFLKKHLSSSDEDWKICAWHYYDGYYHTGKYPKDKNYISDDGESFYDYCRQHGAIIFSAHDHVYARTHVMSQFSEPRIDSYDKKTSSDIVQIYNGATLNILSAVGGYEIYTEGGKYKDYSHWQKKYARGSHSENAKKYGTLNCKFNVGGNNRKAYCQFLRINSSPKVFDSFTIYRNDPSEESYDHVDDDFLAEKVAAYEEKYYGKTSSSSNNKKCRNGHCTTTKRTTRTTRTRTTRTRTTRTRTTRTRTTRTSTRRTKTTKRTTKRTTRRSSSIGYSSSDRCGKNYGKCRDNKCCSHYGWCGKSSQYCDSGCQSLYGKCW